MAVEEIAVLSSPGVQESGEHGGKNAWLTRAVEALPVVALVIYGAVRFGDSAFYGRLGVSPDEVGLDYGRTLGRVAVGIALLAAAVALLGLGGCAVLRSFKQDGIPGVRLGVLGILGLFVGRIALRSVLPPMAPATVLIVGLVPVFAGPWLERKWRSGHLTQVIGSIGMAEAVALGAVLVIAIFGLAGVAGYRAAGSVVDGHPLPCGCAHFLGRNVALPWANGSQGFMGLEAEAAEVRWLVRPAGGSRPALPDRAFLLGDDDGIVVLYDSVARRAIRVPADAVSITTEPRPITWR